jgi:hypothetical protein
MKEVLSKYNFFPVIVNKNTKKPGIQLPGIAYHKYGRQKATDHYQPVIIIVFASLLEPGI